MGVADDVCDDFVAGVHEHDIVHRVVDEDPGGGLHADVVVVGCLNDDGVVVIVVVVDVVEFVVIVLMLLIVLILSKNK